LVDVQKAVLLQADVDERGLQSWEDVVDLPLVDVADDRAPTATLYVQLSYAMVGPRAATAPLAGGGRPSFGGAGGGRAARHLRRHARLRAIAVDEYLLFQVDQVLRSWYGPSTVRKRARLEGAAETGSRPVGWHEPRRPATRPRRRGGRSRALAARVAGSGVELRPAATGPRGGGRGAGGQGPGGGLWE